MRQTTFIRAVLALALALAIAACGRSERAPEPTVEPTAEPTSAPATPTAAPTATNTPEPAADAPTDTPATGAPTGQDADAIFTTVEQTASINSYRMIVSMTNQRGANSQPDTAMIQGEVVKQPPAQHLTSTFRESSGRETTIEIIVVDGFTYVRSADQWIQTSDAIPFNLDEVTLITPQAFVDAEGNFTLIGNEEVNGRQTVHYQGDKTSLPRVEGDGDTFDPSELTAAEVHIWADAQEHFIVRLQLTAEATDGQGNTQTMQLAHEYTDFNADLAIQAPEGATAVVPPPAEGSFATLLGFELTLPEGSNVQFFGGGRIAAITTPLTLDEAVAFLQGQMEANGYTLLSTANTSATERVHTYQKDAKTIVATIFVTGSGGASINLGGG